MELTAAAITKSSNTSFYYSFSLLPKQKREAIHAVYAFCRYTDDIVDEGTGWSTEGRRLRRSGAWSWAARCGGTSSYVILNQLSATARKFNIPVDHFYDLIRGMEMDLSKTRYETFDELYRVLLPRRLLRRAHVPPDIRLQERFDARLCGQPRHRTPAHEHPPGREGRREEGPDLPSRRRISGGSATRRTISLHSAIRRSS